MSNNGEGVFDPYITKRMMGMLTTSQKGGKTSSETLHEREIDVIKLVARGMTNKEISSSMSISVHTVAIHLVNIFRKIGVESRTEAVAYALKAGLITLNDLTI